METISEGLRKDLGKVLCDNLVCGERGHYPRCYLTISKNCPIRVIARRIEVKDLDGIIDNSRVGM